MHAEKPHAALPRPRIALVLPGGGARSAYQVGVLKAIAEWIPPATPLPFAILCGTSAGAINAAVLAAEAGDAREATSALARVWGEFHVPGFPYRHLSTCFAPSFNCASLFPPAGCCRCRAPALDRRRSPNC